MLEPTLMARFLISSIQPSRLLGFVNPLEPACLLFRPYCWVIGFLLNAVECLESKVMVRIWWSRSYAGTYRCRGCR